MRRGRRTDGVPVMRGPRRALYGRLTASHATLGTSSPLAILASL